MSDERPILFFEGYRWHGTTPDEFVHHYLDVHAELGKALPGLRWYESFISVEPEREWPIQAGRAHPDFYAILQFESEDALADLKNSDEWRVAKKDDWGFVGNSVSQRVKRFTWVPEPETPKEFSFEDWRTAGASVALNPGDYPTLVFESYRWHGTSPEDCLQHYLDIHAPLGLKLPGIRWYEAFIATAPERDWPIQSGRARPDFNVVLQFESLEVVAELKGTKAWVDAKLDDWNFVGNTFARPVARFTWIPDPETPPAFSFDDWRASGSPTKIEDAAAS